MALEDFEKALEEEKRAVEVPESRRRHEKGAEHRRHHHRHHHKNNGENNGDTKDRHRHKRRRRSRDDADNPRQQTWEVKEKHNGSKEDLSPEEDDWIEKESMVTALSKDVNDSRSSEPTTKLKRDAWMEAPSALEIDYIQGRSKKPAEPITTRSTQDDCQPKIYDNEINKLHLQNLAEGKEIPKALLKDSSQHEVHYTFGDAGSQWRMTTLKNVYRQAKESSQTIEDVALERYGDLRTFDDAREEQIELERRETYGKSYVGKEKPSGDLFQERKINLGVRREVNQPVDSENEQEHPVRIEEVETEEPPARTMPLDQTALNRLKAQMMKAKIRGAADAASLESEYNLAITGFANRKESDVVVLGAMDNRMLTGGRKGEVRIIDNKRGHERGLVEENEDMSIEDMVREERRTRGQAGVEGQRFAERIAKDARFDNNLDYMDENASKLAKRVYKSEINLKGIAISDFQKINKILDNCPLCHHEDTDQPPIAPIVSLATRTFLTLTPEPEVIPGGTCIVPIQHRTNLLECDDDEWEEIRNFMKSLTRHYHSLTPPSIPLFYENAAHPHTHPHAHLTVIPLPSPLHPTASAFFREAILTSSNEWSQHRKIIDTLSASKTQGLGRNAFRRMMVKQAPYFHVWFELDGGVGHVVEEGWPAGDRFAREVLAGMVGREGTGGVRARGRWEGGDRRVEGFRERWGEWDWTKALVEG